jgi:3-deoxy-D-manno-octulosonic-acid transferase
MKSMFFLYDILSTAALIGYMPVLLTKKGPDSRMTFVKERLGKSHYPRAHIWLHAVSMGEVLAALPLLKALHRQYPDKKILITTITYTGQRVAREKFPEASRIMYFPWDASYILKPVVRAVKPEMYITIETELWPNIFKTLKSQGAQVLMMNGRISPSSFKGYSRLRFFIKKVLSLIDFICMQDETSKERILALGADSQKVTVTGNFKFDIHLPEKTLPWTQGLKGPVLTAGSTHRGEDIIIARAFKEIKKRIPHAILVVAPRHPERFDEVESELTGEGLKCLRRTKISDSAPPLPDSLDAIIVDTIGELSALYASSTVSFVGGSLVPVGGHNIMEPAYWSKPIVVGPHMHNFPIASDFLQQKAAIEVRDAGELAQTVIDLIQDKEKAQEMAEKARSLVDRNIGAVERAMKVIESALKR